MAKTKATATTVADFMEQLPPPLADLVEGVRQLILSTDAAIGEQIKWNSPSFFYTGEMKPFDPKEYKRDIAVLNLHRGYVLLVFPTGAKVPDPSGVLEGTYTDGRRLVTIRTREELKAKEEALRAVLRAWLALVEK
ncbi:hypothetical protein GCM10027275_34860 [Rhabdobacter roseus]|uniref:YdhG-like domain-containing protein n=1 Tax=Rhabdobacter roseus TaxID=1655419 RepID=A0A840TVK1_9BACT|nr:DUF1801 domain-containing protein [Rhabdobacter roseus]MBB5285293.1 hypothetical protein [Rhabdobacter roseus]